MNIQRISKIGLAILLFLCLLPMPYGYYQLVRLLAMIVFGYFAYTEFEYGHRPLGYLFVALAIMFQPIIKISLGRDLWNIVDVIVGVGLIIYAFKAPRSKIED